MSAKLVVATVGTDVHPFDRLVEWVDSWCAERSGIESLIQHGESAPPRHASGTDFLAPGELSALLARSTAAICHGGPSSIMDAREAGRRPLVVPRNPRFGEHVDDHQIHFAGRLADEGMIELIDTRLALHRSLDRLLDEPASGRIPPDQAAPTATVERIGALIDELCTRPCRRLLGIR